MLLLPILSPLASGAGEKDQSFAVALPELEGPVTLGIFAASGERIRLLYRDAGIPEIPSGLNGLIMRWDGRDDAGNEVPSGTYTARGLVHGPLRISTLPSLEMHSPGDSSGETSLPKPLFPRNRITIRAAKDQLLERRPLLSMEARMEGETCVVTAEGLPLLTVKLSGHPVSLALAHGQQPGAALLTVNYPEYTETFSINGLDRVVPLEAGSLVIGAESLQSRGSAGESMP